MQHDGNGRQPDALDRLVERHLAARNREAAGGDDVRDVARGNGAVQLAAVARLTQQNERLAGELLRDGFGVLLALEVVGFELRLLGGEIFAVRLGGAQGFLFGQQEVAGEAVLHLHFVAHLAELFDAFEQDDLHGCSPYSTT